MRKAGYLNDLAAEIRLFSPKHVLSETGYDDLPVKPIASINDAQSNDQLLKDKEKKLLFQRRSIENGELCIGFSCSPTY